MYLLIYFLKSFLSEANLFCCFFIFRLLFQSHICYQYLTPHFKVKQPHIYHTVKNSQSFLPCYHLIKMLLTSFLFSYRCFHYLPIIFQGYVAYLGVTKGDPYRLLYGVDSWGNVCGRNNTPIENVSLSGLDMTKIP